MKVPTGLVATLATCLLMSTSVHAAVIDQVKNKVDAIKNDTSLLKSKVNSVASNLDPLTGIHSKFAEAGIFPAELLELIPTEQIQDAVQVLRDKKIEVDTYLNDPDLETFRWELIDVITGINSVSRHSSHNNGPLPIISLLEQAPRPVLGGIRTALETRFERMKTRVLNTVDVMQKLRDAGLLEFTPGERNDALCSVAGQLYGYRLTLWSAKANYKQLALDLDLLTEGLEDKNVLLKVGIHGYFGQTMKLGNMAVGELKKMKNRMEKQVASIEDTLELLDIARDVPLCQTLVDFVDHE